MIKIDLNSRYNLKNKSMLEQDIAILFSSIRDSLYTYIYPNHFIGLVSEDAFSLYEYMLSKFSESHTDIIKIAVGKSMPFYKSNESWLSAETAMDSIKETQKSYVIFDELTLEILLAGIPHNKLSEYSSKVLANISTTDINLLKIYYDEDMSLQHTAERLYLHKNTVQQHLNRISTQTGYNPRSFKDAVLLYLALHITQ